MREPIQKWHSIVLSAYQAIMFDTLIHSHNIISESSKSYTFEDKEGSELNSIRGYFAMKEVEGIRSKYFIEEQYFTDLPIRVNDSEEIFFKESARARSVVLRPVEITPFRIRPEQCWEDNHEFIDGIAPFKHSQPDYWTLNKIVAIMS